VQSEEIFEQPATVLTEVERRRYFEDGYLLLEGFVDGKRLQALRDAAAELIEESRGVSASNGKFDLEPDHTAEEPRLRRVTGPVIHHETFREFSFEGPVVDLAADLLGPTVRFHHSKLNFKWAHGGEEVKWHQDIQYWPHTDFSPLTIGVYLEDVDDVMGPMGVVPGSHRGELFDLFDVAGDWSGSIRTADIGRVRTQDAAYLKGPAGSVTVHNCCAVHGSQPNKSSRSRPLLLQTYSSGDSYPLLGIGTNGAPGKGNPAIVRGPRQRWMEVEGRKMPVAPDWSAGGYTSIFDVQQR
jgi:ectoine hydroxylase